MRTYTALRKAEPRMWRIWYRMNKRCNDNETYYGDVKVCDDWNIDISGEQGFINFMEDMWDDYEDDLSIDRIDPKGSYDAHNCRWATSTIQNRNTRFHKYTERGKWIKQANELWGYTKSTWMRVNQRVKNGWSYEDAATIPPFGKPNGKKSTK